MRINRKNKRVSKYETLALQRERKAYYLHGEGLYVFRNHTGGTLILPKPTAKGKTQVGPDEEWEGDSYYMSLVRANMAIQVREIVSPEEERNLKMLNEQKLILDQPNRVTNKGVVEQIVEQPAATAARKKKEKPQEKLQEQKPLDGEVLLSEDPLAGVQILG